MNFLDPRLPARFWAKCIPEPNSGCWLWLASVGKAGYSKFGHTGTMKSAHRVAFVAAFGEVPPGLELDHRVCKTRCCVNPRHLEAVTHLENVRRGYAANKSHCAHGHAMDGDGAYRTATGRRRCRVCTVERNRAASSRWTRERKDARNARKRELYRIRMGERGLRR